MEAEEFNSEVININSEMSEREIYDRDMTVIMAEEMHNEAGLMAEDEELHSNDRQMSEIVVEEMRFSDSWLMAEEFHSEAINSEMSDHEIYDRERGEIHMHSDRECMAETIPSSNTIDNMSFEIMDDLSSIPGN